MIEPIRVDRHEAQFEVVFDEHGAGRVFRNGVDTGHEVSFSGHAGETSEQRLVLIELCHTAIDRLRGSGSI